MEELDVALEGSGFARPVSDDPDACRLSFFGVFGFGPGFSGFPTGGYLTRLLGVVGIVRDRACDGVGSIQDIPGVG